MSEDNSKTASSNAVTIQGKARWIVPEDQGTLGHFHDPVSGWRSDDPCRAVHEALASTTFRILYDTFEAGTNLPTSPSDDAQPA
ncbi:MULTISPECIES: hypothetical protein [Asaia]|uniref:Uncharacterized protein n=1 Tax=Asaia bogorensis TaxID=91915 RepID=A0A060QIP9_9PROT|nr:MULTISPECIES: hypothetical protein [Asaia]ETC99269.1 hypothetical protein P792_04855 [Asaia sp. SF2.1]CDG41049.1 hypothetical protein ASAP_3004 [Asaia bogorensis]